MAKRELFPSTTAQRTIDEYRSGKRPAFLCADCRSVLMPTGQSVSFICPQGHGRIATLVGKAAATQRKAWRLWIAAEMILRMEVN